jgi:hypothetical protein
MMGEIKWKEVVVVELKGATVPLIITIIHIHWTIFMPICNTSPTACELLTGPTAYTSYDSTVISRRMTSLKQHAQVALCYLVRFVSEHLLWASVPCKCWTANQNAPLNCNRKLDTFGREKRRFIKSNLFICSLFNDAFSVTHCVASNERMTSELWIGKDLEESGRGLI